MDDFESDPFRAPLFKRIDNQWLGLLLLAGFVVISSIIALCALCCLWRRYRNREPFTNQSSIISNSPIGQRPMSFPMNGNFGSIFNSQNKNALAQLAEKAPDLSEIQSYIPSFDQLQQARQSYDGTTQAYF